MSKEKNYKDLPESRKWDEKTHIEKLIRMLYLFQTQKYITKERIIEDLEISKRTFYRYKKKLENAGIPIYNYDDKHLSIDDGKTLLRLDRITFSDEEILSLIVASKLIENFSDISVAENYKSLMYKVITGLKYAEKKDYVQLVTQNTTALTKEPFNLMRFPHTFLIEIQKATANCQVLQIRYYTFHKNENTEREILPLEVKFYRSMWHIRSFCRLRNDYREFRLDRIESLKTINKTYDKDEFTIEKYIASKKLSIPQTEITVLFKNNIERLIHGSKFNFTIIKEKRKADQTQITFAIDRYTKEEFLRWLLMWGKSCTVLAPKNIEENLKQIVLELNEHYNVSYKKQ